MHAMDQENWLPFVPTQAVVNARVELWENFYKRIITTETFVEIEVNSIESDNEEEISEESDADFVEDNELCVNDENALKSMKLWLGEESPPPSPPPGTPRRSPLRISAVSNTSTYQGKDTHSSSISSSIVFQNTSRLNSAVQALFRNLFDKQSDRFGPLMRDLDSMSILRNAPPSPTRRNICNEKTEHVCDHQFGIYAKNSNFRTLGCLKLKKCEVKVGRRNTLQYKGTSGNPQDRRLVQANKRICLHSPQSPSRNSKYFRLTKNMLLQQVRRKVAKRFIYLNKQRFPYKFPVTSAVYFELPNQSSVSDSSSDSDSEEDVIEMFGKEGKIIEVPSRG